MMSFHRRNSPQSLLFAAALPFGLLADDAMSAHAGTVTVTGANGAIGALGKPGGAGGSATATATSSGASNSATATGGNGGLGGAGGDYYPAGAGGAGGAASSTATASNPNGPASATATSTGGNGGRGGLPNPCRHTCFPVHGGGGGAATAISSATGGGASTVVSNAIVHGGTGGLLGGAAGTASAGASALSTGSGQVLADASAFGAANFYAPGSSASASAQNRSGEAMTTASAPGAVTMRTAAATYALPASALSNAAVGPGSSESLVTIAAGQAVSNANLLTPAIQTPEGPAIAAGAMSAGYGLSTGALTYETTAIFDFSPSENEALDLKLLSYNVADNSAGIAFDNLELQVVVSGGIPRTYNFTSLTGSSGAENFFNTDSISLGTFGKGSSQSIEIEYFLGYNIGTLAAVGDGFGFTYDLVDPPLSAAIPEPSTWAMLIIGFGGLAFAGYRARVGPAVFRKTDVTDENGRAAF
jgi:hypothetical protein